MRTYTLELKVDYDDAAKFDILKDLLFEKGREVLTVAMMLAEKRQPQLALHSVDFFHGNEDFDITADAQS